MEMLKYRCRTVLWGDRRTEEVSVFRFQALFVVGSDFRLPRSGGQISPCCVLRLWLCGDFKRVEK